MIKLTEDDIMLLDKGDNEVSVRFGSLEGYEILWSKKEAKQLKQQILSNPEKAEKWDKKIQFWMDEGLTRDEAERFNQDLTKSDISVTHEIYKENKHLIQQIHDLEESINYEPDLLERLELTKENKHLKEQNVHLIELREFDANIEHKKIVENMKLKEELGKTKADLHIANEQIIPLEEIVEKIKKYALDLESVTPNLPSDKIKFGHSLMIISKLKEILGENN